MQQTPLRRERVPCLFGLDVYFALRLAVPPALVILTTKTIQSTVPPNRILVIERS